MIHDSSNDLGGGGGASENQASQGDRNDEARISGHAARVHNADALISREDAPSPSADVRLATELPLPDLASRPPAGTIQINDWSDPLLKPDQRQTLELLMAGKSIAESAALIGVARKTIYSWLKKDPSFKAAYNEWVEQAQRSSQSRLLALTQKATLAVEKALETGDAKTALQLLKGMGVLRPIEIGPTDPEEVSRQMQLEKNRREVKLKKEEFAMSDDDFLLELGMGVGMKRSNGKG